MLLKERLKGREDKEENVSRKTEGTGLKEEALDRIVGNSFERDYGPVAGQLR